MTRIMKQEYAPLFRRLRIKNALIITAVFLLLPAYAHAQTAVKDATTAATPSAAQSSSLKSKLEELKREIASKAAQIKNEIDKKLQNKAVFGLVLNKTEPNLELKGRNGEMKIATNEYTTYENSIPATTKTKSKLSFALKDIRQDDYLVALGDIDDNNVLTAKKIVKVSPSIATRSANTKYIWGQVEEASSSAVTILNKQSQKLTINIDNKTLFKSAEKDADLREVLVGSQIIAKIIGEEKAIFIYIIPLTQPKNNLKFASPSAKLKQSSTASSKKR